MTLFNKISRRAVLGAAGLALGLVATASPALSAEKVIFGTNWKAQAEHGGFYQAVANGIYAKYGLDVTIRPGGPQINHPQLLAAGKIDFNMGSNIYSSLNYVANNVPMLAVAALFQKDPQVLIAHPNVGNDHLKNLKGKPILISKGARTTYWEWLKLQYGYNDNQIRPYTYNTGPFITNKDAVQQGYLTSEPFAIETKAGFKPNVFLLADYGYETYATTIETSKKLVDNNPDLVQRFVSASIEGWYGYLYGDQSKANALIKKHNPDMTDAQIAYSTLKLKEYGIVDSGDSKSMGIGAINMERWTRFSNFAIKAGLYKEGIDIGAGVTTQFVNKKIGMK